MRSRILFGLFLSLLLTISGCKKDDVQQVESLCPGNMTYIKQDTSLLAGSEELNIYEDNAGGIHVSAKELGQLVVFQFSAQGNFIKKLTLGAYSSTKRLQVFDGYYLSDYTEATTATSTNTIVTGWKNVGSRHFVMPHSCVKAYQYDTLMVYNNNHTATTTVSKINFNGNAVWSGSYEGYYDVTKTPLVVDDNGDLYMMTVDYKGLKWQLLIDGVVYDSPAGIDLFKLTDTMLVKETGHSSILYKLNSSNGSEVWKNKKLLESYWPNDLYFAAINVLNSSIWITTNEFTYVWDKQGNFSNFFKPEPQYCYPERAVYGGNAMKDKASVVFKAHDAADEINNGKLYFIKTDASGNVLWQTPKMFNLNFYCATSTGGFIAATGSGTSIFDANGNIIGPALEAGIIDRMYPNQNTPTFVTKTSKLTVSCSGDIIFALHTFDDKIWLVRADSNGHVQ